MLLRTIVFLGALVQITPTPTVTLPSEPLKFGAFSARFGGDLRHRGAGWPTFAGTWKRGRRVELCRRPANGCAEPARTRHAGARHVRVVDDAARRGA